MTEHAGASFLIRPARADDSATIANLVRELAVYEKLEQFARATRGRLPRAPVRPPPVCRGVHGRGGRRAGRLRPAFPTFSTFRGQPGLYLEDIFVRPEHRGQGIGKALLATRGEAGRGPRLRPARVVGARLERAGDRLLSLAGGAAAGRVDRLPARRRAARPLAALAPQRDARRRSDEYRQPMSRYFQPHIAAMAGYVPGEQPQGGGFIKLNTNENPYPPSPRVAEAIARRP